MHILGLCNGSANGNSSLLLKIALTEAQAQDQDGITVSWIHTASITVPEHPKPLPSSTFGTLTGAKAKTTNMTDSMSDGPDDREAVRNAILDADAIIVATSCQSHQPPGYLKMIMDLIGGPHMDVATVQLAMERDPSFEHDPRLLKPRVLGFVGVGGSSTQDQYAQLLPSMHLWFYCLQAKVVDQFVAMGFGAPGAVLADKNVVERVKTLARNVVSQAGKRSEEVRYLGPREEGACLFCHLRTVEFLGKEKENEVGCVTCGATGKLVARPDGRILPEWDPDTVFSCESVVGTVQHSRDIGEFHKGESMKLPGVQEEKRRLEYVQFSSPI